MSCLGVLFALSEPEVLKFRAQSTDELRLRYIRSELEPYCFSEQPGRMYGLDKSWDAMHRVMTDGTLENVSHPYPYSHVILGGDSMYSAPDYIMVLKTPAEVQDIAGAVQNIDEPAFRKLYSDIDQADYPDFSEEDLEYTWEYFDDAKTFWQRAADESRHVLFTVDQ
jgi:hypothetical protein